MNSEVAQFLKDRLDLFPEPGDIFLVQAVAGRWALDSPFDPAGIPQHPQVLRDGRLGDGQIFDDIAGDAAGMGHQEFQNLKAQRISEGFEHLDQLVLFLSGNIQRAARRWNGVNFQFFHEGYTLSLS